MGCFNSKRDTKNGSIARTSASKTFLTGELYYFKHKNADDISDSVVGGRDKINLFFSLKTDNQLNNILLQNIKIGVYVSSINNKDKFNYIGETEQLENGSLEFYTTYFVDYFFEMNQMLKFEIKNSGKKIEEIRSTLGRIMGARFQLVDFPIIHKFKNDDATFLVVRTSSVKEEVKNISIHFEVQCSFDQTAEYFLIICNSIIDKRGSRVYKSIEKNGKKIIFSCWNLNLNDICLGDYNKEISFDFYKTNTGLIGHVKSTLDTITQHKNSLGFPIIDENLKETGQCKILFETETTVKFVEYLEKGMQVSLIVGVDYTASNGVSSDPSSLHYINGQEPNHYEQAIRTCGSIVAYYDYDQLFPVYGFGGILMGTTLTSHCFNSNFQKNANVEGVDGIITTYRNSLNNVKLDGPTFFTPLIQNMVNQVKSEMLKSESSVYYILLILTDGQIHDMDQTRDILCEAALLPISIIIIGIGDADFSNMVELDGDNIPIVNKKGDRIKRDIVQFVVYKDFKTDVNRLASEVLYEVPIQVEQYYKLFKNFKGLI